MAGSFCSEQKQRNRTLKISQTLLTRYSLCRELVADNASQFVSESLKHFAESAVYGIYLHHLAFPNLTARRNGMWKLLKLQLKNGWL